MAEDGKDERRRRRRVSGPVRVENPAAVDGGPVRDAAPREITYADPVRGKEYTQRDIEDLRYHAYQWKTHFAPGMRINIVESLDQVRDAGIRRQLEKRVRLNGWFDAATGGVSLFLPNIAVDRHPHLRLEKVLFHEVVGHGGLRMLLGDAAFEAYCLEVYGAMDSREKAHWIRSVQGSMSERGDRVAAGAEYMAHLAEGLAYDGDPLTGRYGAQWNAVMDRLERDVPYLVKGQGTVLFRDELRRTLGLAMRTVAAGGRYVEPKGTSEEIGRLVDRELDSLKAMHAGVVPRRYDIVIRLGRAGDVILNSSSRISDYPLELRTNALWGTRFDDKQERHPYSLDDIRGLVGALDSPLAVIESKDDKKGRSVVAIIPKHIVDADGDRCTFVVPITPITNREGYPVLNIDSIYPKKDRDIVFWMSRYNYVLDARTGRPIRDPATGEYVRRNLLRYAGDEFRESWYPAATEGLQKYASDRVGKAQMALVSFVRDNVPAAEDPLSYAASLEEGAVQMKEPSDEQRLNAAELIGRLRDARALQRRALSASAYGAKVIENLEKYNRTGEGMRLFSREAEEFHVTAYDGRIDPSPGTVFVFGSNPEGRHGAGAARTAAERFGAVYGIGEGLRGASYALPTKDLAGSRERGLYNDRDRNWNGMVSRVTEHYREHPYSDVMIDNPYPRSISPERIVDSIMEMYRTAEEHPDKVFKVAYGNGPDEFTLNGYCGGEMAAMFLQAGREHGIIPVNVQFPRIWIEKGLMQEGVVAGKKEEINNLDETIIRNQMDMENEKTGGNIYVTYYGSRDVPENALKVQISTSVPAGMRGEITRDIPELHPDYRTMVGPLRDGRIDEAEYTRRYNEKVLGPNREVILQKVSGIAREARGQGRDVYLYCYCKPGDFCHRYLASNFLNENGIACRENPADRRKYDIGRVPLFEDSAGGKERSASKDVRLATDTAMFLVDRLNAVGIRTELVGQERARTALEQESDHAEFSVADIQKLNYQWNGEDISLRVFAQTFGGLIKQADRTMEDVERIAAAYIESVRKDPASFVPQLKAENMSHWRYFVLPDGSFYSPDHIMAESPEYATQKGQYAIYENILDDRLEGFMEMAGRFGSLSSEERASFLEMEREVSGSDLMQRTLEVNAQKVNERRNRDVANLIQYFENNSDYTPAEKALILKGSMTYSYSEKKKDEGRNEVRLVKITDSNDVSIPVIGGDAAMVVDGLRKGLDFRDSLILARNNADDARKRSVVRDFTGWKVYEKSDREEDAVLLCNDAAGTGWCTGGSVSTARTHLSGGDFHIYFRDGEPLIAIRTQDGRLAEAPRGAHEGQFCTPEEENIAFTYISEGHGITGGADYVADMQDLRKLNSPACTWRDVVMMPSQRRYENGEFGGDTRSWGAAAEAKLKKIMSDSRSERFVEGCYTPQEMAENRVGSEQVRMLLNDREFYLRGDWPALEYIKGSICVNPGNEVSLPLCQSVGGYVRVRENATLDLPQCQSVGGDVNVKENATLDLSQCWSVGGDVNVKENATLDLSQCQRVGGDMNVDKNATLDLSQCQSVGGYVAVFENATLDLPQCQSVGGYVEVGQNATLVLPQCQSVGWYVSVEENATLDLPQCQSVGGDVEVRENATLNLLQCQSVGRYVEVRENATLNLLQCQSVGWYVSVEENATLDLPQCQSVGGTVKVGKNATVDLPQCQSVGWYVSAEENATLDLPQCQSVGGDVKVRENATVDLPQCQSVGRNVEVRENATLNLSQCLSVGGHVAVFENATLDLSQCQSVRGDVKVWRGGRLVCPPDIYSEYHLSDGTVYGYESDGTIYLTPEGINPNTPIHEYTHLWAKAMQKTRPDLWEQIKIVLRAHPAVDAIRNEPGYAYLLGDEDRFYGEVLATVVGDAGEKILLNLAMEQSDVESVVNELKELVGKYAVEDLFEVQNVQDVSFNMVTLGVLKSLVEQKNLGLDETIKNFTDMETEKKTEKEPAVTVALDIPEDLEERIRLAANADTSFEILEVLSKDSDMWVRQTIAENSDAPVAILEMLSKDGSADVRAAVAKNFNTPIDILEILSKDKDAHVRWGTVVNSHTPTEVLAELAKDADEHIRGRVAQNPNTPAETLAILAKDEDELVRQVAAENETYKNYIDMEAGKNTSAESQEASPKQVFLLGGSDLEMQSIRTLLESNGIAFIDKNLSWGAFTSAYADELAGFGDDVKVYGIELSEAEGVALPKGYVRIDHHNDYSDRKSSIEQVAEILGVEMTRDMQLVAANDSGYIPAMKAMGATADEVADIRRRDRAAQGVIEEDERLAEEAIRNMTRYEANDMSVIRTADGLSRFSPITDRLFGTKHIFIYNGNEMCYYGPYAHKFGHANDADVGAGKMYFGGSEESGFFGTNGGAYSLQELEEMVRRMAGEIAENVKTKEDMETERKAEEVPAVAASFSLPESVDRGTVASYVVPGGTVTLAAGAFGNCAVLERVALPEGLTSIRNNAFRGCSSLMEVAVPSTLSAIGGNAFTDCSSLRSIDIPDSVQSIGAGAFTGCDALEEIRISSTAYERLKGSLPSGVSFTLTDIQNREEQTSQETPAARAQQPAPAPRPGIVYATSASSGYRERTIENARSADVTLAFAADFGTAGERLTAKCAGEAYVPVSIVYENSPQGAIAFEKDIETDAEDIERMIAAISEKRGFDTDHVRLNIAGNGMTTLASHGVTQYMADRYVTRMLSVINSRGRIHIDSVRSGGQTGFDEAGIQAARALGIPATVLAPAGWRMRLADDTNEKGFREVSDEAAFKARFEKSVDGYDVPIGQTINIYAGADENASLSNLAGRPFTPAGRRQVYASVEQAFQAAKLEYSRENDLERLESLRDSIIATTDGAELRRLGRSVPSLDTQAWDRDSENMMRVLIQESFRQNPDALQEMLSTVGYEITHRQDTGKWREAFPRAFMAARDNLLQESRTPDIEKYRAFAHDLAMEATVGGDRFTPSDFMYVVLRQLPQADLGLLRRMALDEAGMMLPRGFTPDAMKFNSGEIEAYTSQQAVELAQERIRVNVLRGALHNDTGYTLEVERCILEGPSDLRERVLVDLNPHDVSLEQAAQILDGWFSLAHGKQERAAVAPEPEEEESMEAPSFSFDEGDTASLDYQQPDAGYLAAQAAQESAPQRKDIKEREGRIYTLGLGNRSEADFVQLIPRDVTRVIDMRSYTTNKSCPWFNKSSLRARMVGMGRTYEQMAALSGRTEDRRYLFSGKSSQTDSSGRTVKTVDYDKYGASQDYLKAKAELEAAVDRGERILVLGPEGNPTKGARALLLGQDLARDGYQTYHIDSDMRRKPRVRDQETVITAAIGGRTVSGGDFTQLHFRSDGTFSKEDGLRLSERTSVRDRNRRMEGEPNYGVPVTFEADSSNELDDVNRANVDSSDYTLVFVTERPSVRENRTLAYAGPEASSKVNIPEDADMLLDPEYQDRVARRLVDRIVDHVSYRILRNEGGVDPGNIRLHIQGSDLPHITSRFVEKRAEATDLSGKDIKMMASTGFDLSDRSPLTQEAVNGFVSGVVACIRQRMDRAHVNEEFPEISEDYHLGTVISNFETGVGEAAVLAAQENGLNPVVHHTAACLLTFDNETLHGNTRADEVSFKQRAYMGLEARKTTEQVDREMEERIAMSRIAQDAFAAGLQGEHVVMLRCMGFGNPDILDMVRLAEESAVIISSPADLYEFVENCAASGISGAEKMTEEAVAEKWDYARDLISRSAAMGIAFTTVVDDSYPASMRNVARYDEQDTEVEVKVEDGVARTVARDITVREGSPAVLWYRGDIAALDGPTLSFVGGGRWSDSATGVTARGMASRLAEEDVTMVAGSFEGPQGEVVTEAIDDGARVAFMSDNPLNDPMQEGYVDDITRNDGVVFSEASIDEKSTRQSDRRTRRRSAALSTAIGGVVMVLDDIERTSPALLGELAAAAVIVPAFAVTKTVKHYRERARRQEIEKNGISDDNTVANDIDPAYVVGEDGEGMDTVVEAVSPAAVESAARAEAMEAVRFEGLGDVPIHVDQKPFRMLTCGDETVFLIEKNYVDVVEAVRRMWGDDVRIEDPSRAAALHHEMEHRSVSYGHGTVDVVRDSDMDGTRVMIPKPEYTSLFYVDGAIYTAANAPESTKGLDSFKTRTVDAEMFALFREQALELQKEVMRAADLEGLPAVRFANAYYPVIGRNHVDIYKGDTLRASVRLTRDGRFMVRNFSPGINNELSREKSDRRALLRTKVVHTAEGGVDKASVMALAGEMRDWLLGSSPYESEEYALADREDIDEMVNEIEQNYRRISRNNVDVLCEDAARAISEGTLNEPGGQGFDRVAAVAALMDADKGLMAAIAGMNADIAVLENRLYDMREQYNELAGPDAATDREALLKERGELTAQLEQLVSDRSELERQRGAIRWKVNDIALAGGVTLSDAHSSPGETLLSVDGCTVSVPDLTPDEEAVKRAAEVVGRIQVRTDVSRAVRRNAEKMYGQKIPGPVPVRNGEDAEEKKADALQVVSGLVNDRCIVTRDGRFAYADKDLNIVSAFYDELRPFEGNYGIASRASDGRFNLIGKDGRELHGVWLDYVDKSSEGFCVVRSGSLYNHINLETGQFVTDTWVPNARPFHGGWARIMAGDTDPKEVQGMYNYVNAKNELLTAEWYGYAEDFKDGVAVVTSNGISRAVDGNGDSLGIVKADGGIIPENEKEVSVSVVQDAGVKMGLH